MFSFVFLLPFSYQPQGLPTQWRRFGEDVCVWIMQILSGAYDPTSGNVDNVEILALTTPSTSRFACACVFVFVWMILSVFYRYFMYLCDNVCERVCVQAGMDADIEGANWISPVLWFCSREGGSCGRTFPLLPASTPQHKTQAPLLPSHFSSSVPHSYDVFMTMRRLSTPNLSFSNRFTYSVLK